MISQRMQAMVGVFFYLFKIIYCLGVKLNNNLEALVICISTFDLTYPKVLEGTSCTPSSINNL